MLVLYHIKDIKLCKLKYQLLIVYDIL